MTATIPSLSIVFSPSPLPVCFYCHYFFPISPYQKFPICSLCFSLFYCDLLELCRFVLPDSWGYNGLALHPQNPGCLLSSDFLLRQGHTGILRLMLHPRPPQPRLSLVFFSQFRGCQRTEEESPPSSSPPPPPPLACFLCPAVFSLCACLRAFEPMLHLRGLTAEFHRERA